MTRPKNKNLMHTSEVAEELLAYIDDPIWGGFIQLHDDGIELLLFIGPNEIDPFTVAHLIKRKNQHLWEYFETPIAAIPEKAEAKFECHEPLTTINYINDRDGVYILQIGTMNGRVEIRYDSIRETIEATVLKRMFGGKV